MIDMFDNAIFDDAIYDTGFQVGLFGDDIRRSYIPGYWDGMDKIREDEKKLAAEKLRREEEYRNLSLLIERTEGEIASLMAERAEALEAVMRERAKLLIAERQRLIEIMARDEEDALIALFSMPFVH